MSKWGERVLTISNVREEFGSGVGTVNGSTILQPKSTLIKS